MTNKPFLLAPYGLAWRVARPFLRRHRRLNTHFAEHLLPMGWPQHLFPAFCSAGSPPFRLWIHAASGGEAYLAREILLRLASLAPDLAILCTSMTEQGIEVLTKAREDLSNNNCHIAVAYFPFDEPCLMKKALERVFGPPGTAACVVAMLETEIWPGLLAACREHGARACIINGRMTEKSFRAYRRIRGALRRLAPERILATSPEDAERFKEVFDPPEQAGQSCALSRVSLMPNIKFDRAAPAGPKNSPALRRLLGETPPPVALFASVREEEEKDILAAVSALRRTVPGACMVVAPRHMHRACAWAKGLAPMLDGTAHFKTRSMGVRRLEAGDVVLWDAFGELESLYEIATAVFVGGSLAPLGGQNFLEPLSFGLRPITGPSWSNFYWVGEDIFNLGLVRRAYSADEVAALMAEQLEAAPDKNAVMTMFGDYSKKRQGGAALAADFLLRQLGASAE